MKSTQFLNLFEGYNPEEDFRVLICAFDRKEAQEIANGYALDSHMSGNFDIQEVDSIDNTHYDCDYVLTAAQL